MKTQTSTRSIGLSAATLQIVAASLLLAKPQYRRAQEIGAHTVFMMDGFLRDESHRKADLAGIDAYAQGGHIELALFISRFAAIVDVADAAAEALGFEYLDVFDYQVSTGMGAWLRDNQRASDNDFRMELMKQVTEFFGVDCTQIAEAVLAGVDIGAPQPIAHMDQCTGQLLTLYVVSSPWHAADPEQGPFEEKVWAVNVDDAYRQLAERMADSRDSGYQSDADRAEWVKTHLAATEHLMDAYPVFGIVRSGVQDLLSSPTGEMTSEAKADFAAIGAILRKYQSSNDLVWMN